MEGFEFKRDINRKLEMANSETIKQLIFSILSLYANINPTIGEHQKRVAIIAYYLAKKYNFSDKKISILTLSALLHDIGFMNKDDRKQLKGMESNKQDVHAVLGSKMIYSFTMKKISSIVKNHHIDNREYDMKKKVVPLEAMVISFANQIELLFDPVDVAIKQKSKLTQFIKDRPVYYPDSFFHFLGEVEADIEFWYDIDSLTLKEVFKWINIDDIIEIVDYEVLEEFTLIYSKIIDYRSKYSISHSNSVGKIAYSLAKSYGVNESKCQEIRLAGYLHDIGKIIVPNEIWEKNSKLTEEEYEKIQYTKFYTTKIVKSIKGFERISEWINEHSEFDKLENTNTASVELQAIYSANVITALCEARAYRPAFPVEKVRAIISEEIKPKVNSIMYEIIEKELDDLYDLHAQVQRIVARELEEIYS